MGSKNSSVEDIDEAEEEEEDGQFGRRRDYDPEFKGPLKDRSCTDVLCLFLFLAMIGAWIFVAVLAFMKGNPMTLIYPSNSRGEICGQTPYE